MKINGKLMLVGFVGSVIALCYAALVMTLVWGWFIAKSLPFISFTYTTSLGVALIFKLCRPPHYTTLDAEVGAATAQGDPNPAFGKMILDAYISFMWPTLILVASALLKIVLPLLS